MDKKSGSQKRKAIRQRKSCPECGAPMKPGRTTLHFERGGFYAEVKNVTAMLCGRCGTKSIPGPTATKISDAVKRLFKVGKDLNSTGIFFFKDTTYFKNRTLALYDSLPNSSATPSTR